MRDRRSAQRRRQFEGEHRATAGPGSHGQRRVHQPGQARARSPGPGPDPCAAPRRRVCRLRPGRTLRRCAPAAPGMPKPLSQTCISTLPPRLPAADQHAAVVGVADGVADQVAQDALHAAPGRQRPRAGRRASAGPGPFRRPWVRSAGAACAAGRASRTGAGFTSTPPVSMRVMSSSSENRPSSASTDSLMLFTSGATSGSWVRWRSASANRPIACSGWRKSWLAAAKNCVFARLAISAARRAASASCFSARNCASNSLGLQFQLDDLGQRLPVVAAQHSGDDDESSPACRQAAVL